MVKDQKIATAAYLQLAEENQLSLTQLALAFVKSRPFVTSTILGASTLDQLKVNIEADEYAISPDIIEKINAIHHLNPNPAP